MKKYAIIIASLTLSCGLSSSLSFAQGTTSNSGWYKACSENVDTKICNVQIQNIASTGQTIASLNLANITGNIERKVFQITVPTNRLLPPGIELKVDDNKSSTVPYSFCLPSSCAAEIELTDQLVESFKAGKVIQLISTNDRGQKNPITVTLEGFGDAYDGDPVTREALAERQKKLSDQLSAKAKEKRNKLLEAQKAAKENSQASE